MFQLNTPMSTKLPDVFICFLLTVGVVLSYGPPSWQLDHGND